MTLRIERIGTALPAHAIPQATSAAWSQAVSGRNSGRERLIPAVFKSTRIQRRYSVLLQGNPLRQEFFPPARDAGDRGPTTAARMARFDAEVRPLARRAATDALGGARDVTHLVTVSCSGFRAPGFDLALVDDLGLPRDVARTHVGFMGCHGLLNGLRVAKAFLDADPAARVLVCSVELCSVHYDYGGETPSIVANALFADGAAALLCTGEAGAWTLAASGSVVVPDTAGLMTWDIGDHGFAMGLSPDVPAAIERHLAPWLTEWLARHGLSRTDVGSWCVHPGGPRILSTVEHALGLPPAATAESRTVLEQCGNMSSATVGFILDRLMQADAPRPCVALGFGPGLTVEAALFRNDVRH